MPQVLLHFSGKKKKEENEKKETFKQSRKLSNTIEDDAGQPLWYSVSDNKAIRETCPANHYVWLQPSLQGTLNHFKIISPTKDLSFSICVRDDYCVSWKEDDTG